MTHSAIYSGTVMHQRLRPAAHHLRYRMLTLLLDLDELPGLAKNLRLFALDRFSLFGFRQSDHGDGSRAGLRLWVEAQLAAADIDIGHGPIRLLTMPRILGHAFNPLSVYFCHRADGGLAALLYEVRNTFGERHVYLIAVGAEAASGGTVRQRCAKGFYVSPFMDMRMNYDFRVSPPAESVSIVIDVGDDEGRMLVASFAAKRRPLTDGALFRAFLAAPLLGLKVLAGIHWEALRIWRKGVALRPHVAAPATLVTVVR